jgi:GNAT superfamily N-acetyltransferase
VRAAEVADISSEQWRELEGDEPHPWGGGAEDLSWAEKQRHVGVTGEHGELLAVAAALVAEVAAGPSTFEVVGIGGVIVRPGDRGRGLARLVIEGILEIARELGPDRAMLFCREPLVALYERFGFRMIDARVTAAQPGGRIAMPLRAMWAPLREGVAWPAGEVAVAGEPF